MKDFTGITTKIHRIFKDTTSLSRSVYPTWITVSFSTELCFILPTPWVIHVKGKKVNMHVSIYAYIRTHVRIRLSRCIETRCIHMSTKYKLYLIQERIKYGWRMQVSARDIFVHTTYYHHPFSMFQCYLFF